jgi:predicted dithiol-disulfide oxidoreductase (DUF899 family)
MKNSKIVSRNEWLDARKALLAKEKEFTRLKDHLTQERQNLPWVKIEKDYQFDNLNGNVSLSDLFNGKSQLIVYHFMFEPNSDEGCQSCSYMADGFNGLNVHLNQRDINLDQLR